MNRVIISNHGIRNRARVWVNGHEVPVKDVHWTTSINGTDPPEVTLTMWARMEILAGDREDGDTAEDHKPDALVADLLLQVKAMAVEAIKAGLDPDSELHREIHHVVSQAVAIERAVKQTGGEN